MRSLFEVARRSANGRLNPRLRDWAMKRIKRAGSPADDIGRARAIYDAVVTEKLYVPDPVDAELIVGAHCTLDRCGPLSFEGGDCDDLVVATSAAIESVGIPVVIVCHSYRMAGDLPAVPDHVLLAIWDKQRRRWWYADPSARPAVPMGKIVARPTREIWIGVPSMRVVCNANGPCDQSKITPDVMSGRLSGDFVGVGEPAAPQGGVMLQPITGKELADLQVRFAQMARSLEQQQRVLSYDYELLVATRKLLGRPLFDEYVYAANQPVWTKEQQDKLSALNATTYQAISYSRQGAAGERRIERDAVTGRTGIVAYGYEPAIFVEGDGSFVLVNAGGRQGQSETIPAGMFGFGWPAAALGIAVALGAGVAIYALSDAAKKHIEATRQKDLQQHERALIERGSTPREARDSVESIQNGAAKIAVAAAEEKKADPVGKVADAITVGILGMGGLVVLGGGIWAISQLRRPASPALRLA